MYDIDWEEDSHQHSGDFSDDDYDDYDDDKDD